jgi:hypothetical protein
MAADDQYALVRKDQHRFLAGINDEGRYFLHEFDPNQGAPTANLEDLVLWMNRAGEGFTKRVQGDVLLQFVQPQPFFNQGNPRGSPIPLRLGNQVFQFIDYQLTPSELRLGNHRLTSDGRQAMIGTYVVISATEFVLQHPQHGIVTERIPKGHFAVLAPQMGRTWGYGFD